MNLANSDNWLSVAQQQLKKTLVNSPDPIKTIEEIQLDKGILLPSLRPMLPLLDLHGVKRLEFHHSVLDELNERLRQQTEKLGRSDNPQDHRRLQELLVRSFAFIKIPTLQPVVMAVLKNVNNLDGKILNMLISDKNIYNACDLGVKRQIWLDVQSMFADEVKPLLQQYIQEKKEQLPDPLDIDSPIYATTPKQRRQNRIVQELANMVGDNIRLYETIVQFLRTLFVKTQTDHYCSLRVELLMALHDKDVHDITTMDQAHKFVWCLDACIREQAVDPKRSRELQSFLESIESGEEHVLADVSMVLCDPHAVHFLATSAFKILNHLISNEALPRGHPVLLIILRCLNLGLYSHDIIDSSVFREPKLDVKIFTKFLPMMMTIFVDDAIRGVSQRIKEMNAAAAEAAEANANGSSSSAAAMAKRQIEQQLTSESLREHARAIIEHSGPPPESFQRFIDKDRLAAVLARHLSHFRVKFASSNRQSGLSRAQM